MSFGLKVSQQFASIDQLRRVWRAADDGGWDGCWVFDHLAPMGPVRTGDIFEAWTLLAAMAEATWRVRIGCIVSGNQYRHPALLAKMAVTVDHLSGGRLDVGLGAGGDDHVDRRIGLPERSARERIAALAESCRVLDALWSDEVIDVEGEHCRLTDAGALGYPKPVQRPRPPVWIGSSGERYGLRVVAQHADGWFSAAMPGAGTQEHARLSSVLDQHCADVGRDPAAIRRAVQFPLPGTADEVVAAVAEYRAAGFTDVVFIVGGGGATAADRVERAAELLPRLRELG
jgi:alkanesulfonate monooxygenase SsuD/methylene tetrahydromethanopterin reductase-like flavin-dependent oxidoreductase (luciferase family)